MLWWAKQTLLNNYCWPTRFCYREKYFARVESLKSVHWTFNAVLFFIIIMLCSRNHKPTKKVPGEIHELDLKIQTHPYDPDRENVQLKKSTSFIIHLYNTFIKLIYWPMHRRGMCINLHLRYRKWFRFWKFNKQATWKINARWLHFDTHFMK